MSEAINNQITGTWEVATAGAGITGQVVVFHGTVTATGQTFTAVSTGLNIGPSLVPSLISAGGGGFTFNGDLSDFAGWALGGEMSSLVNAGYSMTTGGRSLVMYGAQGEIGFSFGGSYTDVLGDGAGWSSFSAFSTRARQIRC